MTMTFSGETHSQSKLKSHVSRCLKCGLFSKNGFKICCLKISISEPLGKFAAETVPRVLRI